MKLLRRHPRATVLSRYLEGDLDARDRRVLEAHVGDCPRCRRELALLTSIVGGLDTLRAGTPTELADSIIAALREEKAPETATTRQATGAGQSPVLTVVRGSGHPPIGDRIRSRWPQEARAALRWCLERRQLRLTLPITVVAGVVLTLANMGGMLMHGKIDLGVCVSCTIDFLVPFLVLNLGLLMLLRLPGRSERRPG